MIGNVGSTQPRVCDFMRPTEADIPSVVGLFTSAEVRRYLGGPISTVEAERRVRAGMLSWERDGFGPWIVRETGTGHVVGYGGLSWYEGGPRIEVSYQVFPEWWRHGYGLAIVKHSVSDGFTRIGAKAVWAETQAANEASRRLLRRAGFRFVCEVERHGEPQEVFVLHRPDQ
jgi:[ribosomal protein S5]-alanine N-acetyltransferase